MIELIRLFEYYFTKNMKKGNVHVFKKTYRTLYNDVFVPTLENAYNEMQSARTERTEFEKNNKDLHNDLQAIGKSMHIWKNEFRNRFGTDNIREVLNKIDQLQEIEKSHRVLLNQLEK